MEALDLQDIPACKPMSATAYAAMLSATHATGTQEEEICKHLQYALGKKFLPTRASWRMMGEGHTLVKVGKVPHKYSNDGETETVEYSEKDMHDELIIQLERYLRGKKIDPVDIKRITLTAGGDHGGDAFQFGAKVTVHFHNGKPPINIELSVAEVICRTDSAELLEATIVPGLSEAMKRA